MQKLNPVDHPMRFRFAKCANDWLTEDADSGKKKIFFSGEAHLIFVGMKKTKIVAFGKEQNGTENLYTYIEKPTHPVDAPSRCLVQRHNWAIFLSKQQVVAVAVNGDRYQAMLNEFLFTKTEEDIGNIWFQQDEPHTRSYTRCFGSCF